MAQAINTSSDGEWTTVNVKKGYVPPHLRTKETTMAKPLSLADEDDFPTLGGTSTQKSVAAKANNPFSLNLSEEFTALGSSSKFAPGFHLKASFTQKIKNLIEIEQQNEADRAAAEERKKELEGFVALPLTFTPERYMEWNEKISAGISKEKDYGDLTHFTINYIPPTPYPTPLFPNLPRDNYNDNMSDDDNFSEFEYNGLDVV
jgi:hypothetical protein